MIMTIIIIMIIIRMIIVIMMIIAFMRQGPAAEVAPGSRPASEA